MRNSSFFRLLLRKRSRNFHKITERFAPVDENRRRNYLQEISCSDWRAALEEELASKDPKQRKNACIYKVPVNMRDVEPKAYHPNIISIGPYHHGKDRDKLQQMEELKWKFFHRLFDPTRPNRVKLDPVVNAMEDLEHDARSFYWDDFEISSEKFVKMMLLDGCLIVELFKELKQHDFKFSPSLQRWMLPTLQRDLIMLENQLPLFVLEKFFELTNSTEESSTSLQDLALRFFNPLLQRDPKVPPPSKAGENYQGKHFLDLFRTSILPRHDSLLASEADDVHSNSIKQAQTTTERGIEGEGTQMIRSITELKKAGIVIEKGKNCAPLDVQSEGKALKIPPLYIDDHRGTLFRNMVAFEQCHHECRPDVTSYLFFFDGLINSAEDVELLHHKEVIHHSLGSNKEVAKLVNSLCKEIAPDAADRSYLHQVVSDANDYFATPYARIRAKLVHHYFSSWVVGVSTIGALIALYLTLIQTGCGVPDAINSTSAEETSFRSYLIHCFLLPFYSESSSKISDTNKKIGSDREFGFLKGISPDWFLVC